MAVLLEMENKEEGWREDCQHKWNVCASNVSKSFCDFIATGKSLVVENEDTEYESERGGSGKENEMEDVL
jgi:hypothetical protein